MGNAFDRFADKFAIGNAPGNYFQPLGSFQKPVVAKRSCRGRGKLFFLEETFQELGSYLPGGACNEDLHEECEGTVF